MVLGTRTVLIDLPGIEYMEAVIDRGDAILVRDQTELAERLDNAPLAKDSAYYYASPAQQLVMA